MRLILKICILLSFTAHASALPSKGVQKVILGEERLGETRYAELLRGKRIGVLAHHASRNHEGKHIVDFLASLSGVQLKMIFAPEHGYRSIADDLNPDSVDAATGVPVYSLYGPRKAPTPEMLNQIDLVVIDLQDVGLRYYTYPATVVNTMQAAKLANKPVLILDRPNPLGGSRIEGALLEPALVNGGLTTLASIPTRHGMTLGELSIFFNDALAIHAELTVVPMSGWKRDFLWNETDMPWTPPSPALLRPEQAMTYAALGSLESGDLAVGRGQNNDQAFFIFGAPWISSTEQTSLVKQLNVERNPQLSFEAHTWTPDRAKYQGQLCRGFRVILAPESNLDSFGILIQVAETLRAVFGIRFDLTHLLSMVGANWALQGIIDQKPVSVLETRAKDEAKAFLEARAKALLY